MHSHQQSLPIESVYLNALLNKDGIIDYHFSPYRQGPTKIYYSFKPLIFNDEKGDVFSLSENNQEVASYAMRQWEKIANILFIESNNVKDGHLFFREVQGNNSSVAGDFQMKSYLSLLKNRIDSMYLVTSRVAGLPEYAVINIFRTSSSERVLREILLHEIGHALALNHPFRPPYNDLIKEWWLTRAFSVMNYNHCNLSGCYVALSPMHYDIKAIHHIYGLNNVTGSGNDIYDFTELSHHAALVSSQYNTIETIYDVGGEDTIVVRDTHEKAIIDLNVGPNHRSTLGMHHLTFYGDSVKNIKSNAKSNLIILNEKNNQVELGAASNTATIITYGYAAGHDVIFGFQPQTSQLIIQRLHTDLPFKWELNQPSLIESLNGTVLQIDKDNSIFIQGVEPTSVNMVTELVDGNMFLREKAFEDQKNASNKVLSSLCGSVTHGILRGALPYSERTLQEKGYSQSSSRYISQAIYYAGFFTMRLADHSEEIQDINSSLNAIYQSSLETGQVLMMNAGVSFINKFLTNATAKKVFNKSASLLSFSIFAKKIVNEGLLTSSAVLLSGMAAETLTKKIL